MDANRIAFYVGLAIVVLGAVAVTWLLMRNSLAKTGGTETTCIRVLGVEVSTSTPAFGFMLIGVALIAVSSAFREPSAPTLLAPPLPREIRSKQSYRCLDADLSRNLQDGTRIQLWVCTDEQNQKWVIKSDGTIVNAASGRCLDADRAGIEKDATMVQLWVCTGEQNQRWEIKSNGTIVSAASGRCLDADRAGIERDGTMVQLWGCTGGKNQNWEPSPQL
jgi:hypothetical protein